MLSPTVSMLCYKNNFSPLAIVQNYFFPALLLFLSSLPRASAPLLPCASHPLVLQNYFSPLLYFLPLAHKQLAQ